MSSTRLLAVCATPKHPMRTRHTCMYTAHVNSVCTAALCQPQKGELQNLTICKEKRGKEVGSSQSYSAPTRGHVCYVMRLVVLVCMTSRHPVQNDVDNRHPSPTKQAPTYRTYDSVTKKVQSL
jgi:hypothetical protein